MSACDNAAYLPGTVSELLMLACYVHRKGHLQAVDPGTVADAKALVWLDLHSPAAEEQALVEELTGLAIPSLAAMQEIEVSSRLYEDRDALFMTVPMVSQVEAGAPVSAPVSFILGRHHLITLRHTEPKAFKLFVSQAGKVALVDHRPAGVFLGLLETIVDRFADILELISADADGISAEVFRADELPDERSLEQLLKAIGRCGDLISKLRESVASTIRMLTWFGHPENGYIREPQIRDRVKTLGRDLASLGDYSQYQGNKIQFLLDATLGRINIEQTKIIKIFSIAAAAFLPPTLIASIYGMNFDVMPELHWSFGYPLAIGAMALSAVLPLWYFRRRGWL
ncbi:MAG: magnesium transporter CorA family protein [Xanthomonadales bacterium]|nr:magnesium transporter CorA family protein [Xanthomonadales bacterium]